MTNSGYGIFDKFSEEYFKEESSAIADGRVRTRQQPGSPAGATQLHLEEPLTAPVHAVQERSKDQKPGLGVA